MQLKRPGIPCALSSWRDDVLASLGRNSVAGRKTVRKNDEAHLNSVRHCGARASANPEIHFSQHSGGTMDSGLTLREPWNDELYDGAAGGGPAFAHNAHVVR